MPNPVPLPSSPPTGWTTDPEELDYEGDWAADDSDGQELCAEYKLGRGYPVMYCPSGCVLMFAAGGKFYLWTRLDCSVYEIVSSTDLDVIIDIMEVKGANALKTKECLG